MGYRSDSYRLLLGAALAALTLVSGCEKKSSAPQSSGGPVDPNDRYLPDPETPPEPVTGFCSGIHGCTAGSFTVTTEEECARQGGTFRPRSG